MACIQCDQNTLKTKQNDGENQNSTTQPSHNIINVHGTSHNSDSPPNLGCNVKWSPNLSPLGINKPIGWMDGLLGCMRPVVSLLVKANSNDTKPKVIEDWEIQFESISNLEWLGSGAQGTVFSGYLRNEIVAVKKVRDYKETDIKHLRRLDHENIIKFKGVCTQSPVFCIIMEVFLFLFIHRVFPISVNRKWYLLVQSRQNSMVINGIYTTHRLMVTLPEAKNCFQNQMILTMEKRLSSHGSSQVNIWKSIVTT
ncbi:mitogen-activated protein kinase kinase kinase 13-like isoform X2 [Contarinia nasturtii]|nr:mitogen-activated protein kinase kinase kinase 13-like isoform X2 [Contarinia nasturtii]